MDDIKLTQAEKIDNPWDYYYRQLANKDFKTPLVDYVFLSGHHIYGSNWNTKTSESAGEAL